MSAPEIGEVRVSVAEVLAAVEDGGGGLPVDVVGVQWTDTGWFECRGCIEHISWRSTVSTYDQGPSDDRTGILYWEGRDYVPRCDNHIVDGQHRLKAVKS